MNYHAFKFAICGRKRNLAFIVMVRIIGKSMVAPSAAVKIFLFCKNKKCFLPFLRMIAAFAQIGYGNRLIFLVIKMKIF